MEAEQPCVNKTFHGANHLGNGKHSVTAAVHVMVVQKSPCAVLGSIRKGNGLWVSHRSTDWNSVSRTCLAVFWPLQAASDESHLLGSFLGHIVFAELLCGASSFHVP